MTIIWVCNPQRPEGVPQAERVVPPASERMPDLHTLLRVALVEADDGLVRTLRAIVLAASLTTILNAAIRAQAGGPTCPYRVLRVVGRPALPGTVSASMRTMISSPRRP